MSVEDTNKAQENSLTKLREKLAAKKELVQEVTAGLSPQILAIVDVPEVMPPNENHLFSLERHDQLCDKVDALHHNYLVTKAQFDEAEKNMVETLKEFSIAYADLISEGMKVRWS